MRSWITATMISGGVIVSAVPDSMTSAGEQPASVAPNRPQVVLLGTGNPPADPDRSSRAAGIVADDTAYLVDFGAGVVRRAKAAAVDRGIAALEPVKLRVVFVTHLHSDHTVGYPDFILTPWVLGRRVPLEVYRPAGIKGNDRARSRSVQEPTSRRGPRTVVCTQWVRFQRAIRSTRTKSDPAWCTRMPTSPSLLLRRSMQWRATAIGSTRGDRSIVISGDTNPTQATIDACQGCDVLIHEVLTLDWLARRPDFRDYASQFHTTTAQLTKLATQAKPRLLILYHASLSFRPAVDAERTPLAVLLTEMSGYGGHVVVGRDLDVY